MSTDQPLSSSASITRTRQALQELISSKPNERGSLHRQEMIAVGVGEAQCLELASVSDALHETRDTLARAAPALERALLATKTALEAAAHQSDVTGKALVRWTKAMVVVLIVQAGAA